MLRTYHNLPKYLTYLYLICILEADEKAMESYVKHSRNILNPLHKEWDFKYKKIYKKRCAIVGVLSQLPESIHDPSTFTIDVLRHDVSVMINYYKMQTV